MKKYEEEHYRWKNIREDIYPWIKESLVDHQALNGKYISDKDTPCLLYTAEEAQWMTKGLWLQRFMP